MKGKKNVTRPGLLGHMGLTVFILLFLFGCMGGRTLTIDVKYDTKREPDEPFAGASGMKVALIPFERSGDVKDVFGKWVGLRGKEDILISSVPVDEAVTGAAADYLKTAGFDVTLAPKGTRPEEYKSPPPDLVIHGSVESLSSKAVSQLGSTKIKTELKLRVFITNVRDGSILTINIEGSSEPKDVVSFKPDIFRDTVNEVLSESLERIFSNTVLDNDVVRPKG